MRISDWSSDVCSSDLVGRAAERRDQGVRRRVVHEIHLEDRDPFDRLAGEQVDAGDAGARVRLAYDLRPAAGRDSQIAHGARPYEAADFLGTLDQLVGGTRRITLSLRAPENGAGKMKSDVERVGEERGRSVYV